MLLSNLTYSAFKVYILSVCVFPEDRTHDLALLYQWKLAMTTVCDTHSSYLHTFRYQLNRHIKAAGNPSVLIFSHIITTVNVILLSYS